jgi:glycosyltransferase involved in cell wall biosynthesis
MNYSNPKLTRPGIDEPNSSAPKIKLPRVTVVVTCFNYGRYVVQALDSVASQSYRHFECIVVDDGSTDDSARVIEQWLATQGDARFQLIRSETNKGQMASFAAGLAASEGEFVAFLDADDFWFSEFLQRHLEVHLNNVQFAPVSCSDLVQIDESSRILAGTYMGPFFEVDKTSGHRFPYLNDGDLPRIDPRRTDLEVPEAGTTRYFSRGYSEYPWTVTSGMVFRRTMLDIVMPRDVESVPICADGYVFVMCHFFSGSLATKHVLAAYRRHKRNQFAFLPVHGVGEISPMQNVTQHRKVLVQTMLDDVLERYDELSVIFTAAMVNSLVRRLFRNSLRLGIPSDVLRLRAVLGHGRVFRDQLRARVKFFRRNLR